MFSHDSLLPLLQLPPFSISSAVRRDLPDRGSLRMNERQFFAADAGTRGPGDCGLEGSLTNMHMHLSDGRSYLAFSVARLRQNAISIKSLIKSSFQCNLRTRAPLRVLDNVQSAIPAGQCTHYCSKPWHHIGNGSLVPCLPTRKVVTLDIIP